MLPVDFMKTNIEKHFTHTFSILLFHETFKQKEDRHFFSLLFKIFSIENMVMPFTAFSSLLAERLSFE